MKFNVGEKIKFLNDVGGGTITSIIDKKMVLVRTEDGFEIPVLISELVHYGGEYFKPQKEILTVDQPVVKEFISEEEDSVKEEEIWFAIMPVEQSSELFAYLINNSSYHLHYAISIMKENEQMLFDQGTLESGVKIRMGKFMPENINNLIRFDIQIIRFKTGFYIMRDPINFSLFVKPGDIYSGIALDDNDFFEKKAALFLIPNEEKKNILIPDNHDKNIRTEKVKKVISSNNKENKPEEIDLHIGEIIEDYSKLEPGEILDIQMARFKTSLETAIIHKTKRIVFIHGIGNGKLKHTVRKALDEKYPDLQYQDASFKEYGYGATMVIIK